LSDFDEIRSKQSGSNSDVQRKIEPFRILDLDLFCPAILTIYTFVAQQKIEQITHFFAQQF
jgi:hypothetical protein